MKIVILDGYTANPGDLSWEGFEQLGEVTVYDRTISAHGNEEILRRAKGAQIILVNKTVISKETIAALKPELQYIGVLATGYNVVDVEAAAKYNVAVSNIPAYGTTAVAQFTMALLLEMCYHVGEHAASTKAGEWSRSMDFSYWKSPLQELSGKTFGIIGFGRIGRATAQLAKAFGMNVIACSRTTKGDEFVPMVPLDELLKRSDVISLHCPLFAETRGMINRENIAKMKDGVLLLNTSRGPLICEEDLAQALESGKVAGAAVDVLTQEPPDEENPLLHAKNCIVTPHIAWASKESRTRLMDTAVQNLRSYLAGHPQNLVTQ